MKNKIFLYLLLFFTVLSQLNAQNVYIPDVYFKNELIDLGIDTNQDGEIQYSEAVVITYLNVAANHTITDLTGISAFVNLETLYCFDMSLTSLDVSALVNLKVLACTYNQLTQLEVSGLVNLEELICAYNQLTQLDISDLVNLKYLNCSNNQLSYLDVSTLVNLESLSCQFNQFTNLDVSHLVSLKMLLCGNNQLTNLDLSDLINLEELICTNNQLTHLGLSNNLVNFEYLGCNYNQFVNLDVTPLTNLVQLHCDFNQLINLTVNGLSNLKTLYCEHNQLSHLDISTLENIDDLRCGYNQLTNLDMANLTNITTLVCQNNQITSLDLMHETRLFKLFCNNNNLSKLYIKNGSIEGGNTFQAEYLYFSNNPNLQYICADSAQLASIEQKLIDYGMTNVIVNSFCFASSGSNYHSISGECTSDLDINGCTTSDSVFSLIKIAITDGIITDYTHSNHSGLYTTFVDTGTFTFTPQIQNPTYFSVSPSSISTHITSNSNNVQLQDFCIVPNGVFPDVEIAIIPINPARPGFDANYKLIYHNKGTTLAAGSITLNYMQANMDFLTASIAPTMQDSNQLTWIFSNLHPSETRSIEVAMNILPPTINNIGDVVNFTANIELIDGIIDTDTSDNECMLSQPLVGAYDPNDKTCLEGDSIYNTKMGEYLHYLIRFQNTGNFYAENIAIIDSIDVHKYDISSIQLLESSHLCYLNAKEGRLQFYFKNIMLQDSFTNEAKSHGYVLFKIKTNPQLAHNSTLSNKAEIYFDYNPPIVTNTAITVFRDAILPFQPNPPSLSAPHFHSYPNPVENILTIETTTAIDIMVVNVMGETMMNKTLEGKNNLDISTFPKGIYWIKEKGAGKGQMFMKY